MLIGISRSEPLGRCLKSLGRAATLDLRSPPVRCHCVETPTVRELKLGFAINPSRSQLSATMA